MIEDGSSTSERQVTVRLKPRSASNGKSTDVAAQPAGQSNMIYSDKANFTYYDFSIGIPTSVGVSSFDIIVSHGSKTITYNNDGDGYLLQDAIFELREQSCKTLDIDTRNGDNFNWTQTAMAAVSAWLIYLCAPIPVLLLSGLPMYTSGRRKIDSVSWRIQRLIFFRCGTTWHSKMSQSSLISPL